jgi:hypothetical protein
VRCQWKDLDTGARCADDAKPRKGNRGPRPRHCEEHTAARKRQLNHHPLNPRSSRPVCCQAGVCDQHLDNAAVKAAWRAEDYHARVNERAENRWFLELLDNGYHVECQLPATDRGPDEGRTRPGVFHPSPFRDAKASAWFEVNHGWISEKIPVLTEV